MIHTARLILRPWREEDEAPFQDMSRSPAVMEHLGGPASPETTAAGMARIAACQAEHGHCFWAIERQRDNAFLGFCGLKIGDIGTIKDEIEIGWRLREDAWGQGYAREAAEASFAWGWANLPVARIVAITVDGNRRSWGLMERLGMTRQPDMDFGHPAFAPGHPLHRHIAYIMDRPDASIRAVP